MLTARRVPSVCLSCRLSILASASRQAHADARAARVDSRWLQRRTGSVHNRAFTTTRARRDDIHEPRPQAIESQSLPIRDSASTAAPTASEAELVESIEALEIADEVDIEAEDEGPPLSIDETVRQARHVFGDKLPRNYLTEEEFVVYERLYGSPVFVDSVDDIFGVEEGVEEGEGEEIEVFEEETEDGRHVLLRKLEDGSFEEIRIFGEEEGLLEEEEEGEFEEGEVEDGVEVEVEEMQNKGNMTAEEWAQREEDKKAAYHQDVYDRSMQAREESFLEEEGGEGEEEDDFMRAHPLTVVGRGRTSPSTVYLPKESFVNPVAQLLTRPNHKHLQESALRIFGGHGLPYSASVAGASSNKEQKPIPLEPSRADMGNIESDAYLAAVMPGTYASVMSTLVEVRKRLGTSWIDHLLKKKGGPMVLDAGAGGAGVIAWHEVLKAEWARMHEESGTVSRGDAPLGRSTVLTASDTLRHRASRLLENTTFIPRLPDLDTADQENVHQPRKLYDLIIAPHTLWPLKQEFMRKELIEKYWGLLNPKGGVLIILEKGLPRGFEVVAAAREYLLDKHIASPSSTHIESAVDAQLAQPENTDSRFMKKETGMIIAPCTNHTQCPMYKSPGVSVGRKDFCFFSQRYIRPPFLQRILNATDRNHEDVQFSYIAVQRGRDLRLPIYNPLGHTITQDAAATDAAFAGHEWKVANDTADGAEKEYEMKTPEDVSPLSLPRLMLPALKRRGHIVMDVCTPSGTLERWTVPRSFSKQAFRDARKAQWGDLWALGAKTRTPKNVRLGRPRDEFDRKGRRIKAARKSEGTELGGGEGAEGRSGSMTGKNKKKVVINVDMSERGFEGFREEGVGRKGRYVAERRIRGSGGRKGRRSSQGFEGRRGGGGIMDELD